MSESFNLLLESILFWAHVNSEPNERYSYYHCPVCNATWWEGDEKHGQQCWVPKLQRAVKNDKI